MERTVAVKYVGISRRGTVEPPRIWGPGEVKEVSKEVADELTRDPLFILIPLKEKPTKAEAEKEAAPTPAAQPAPTPKGKRKRG